MAEKPQPNGSSSPAPEGVLAALATEDLAASVHVTAPRAHDPVAEQLKLLRDELVVWRTREHDEGPTLQDLREELQSTLRDELAKSRAQAEAVPALLEAGYRDIEERIKALINGGASVVDGQLRVAAKAIHGDIERLVQEAKQEHAAIDHKRARTESVLTALIEISDQQAEHVLQYQPGTIQQLRQRLDVLQQEREELRKQKLDAEALAMVAQGELQSYKVQHGLGDLTQLENQKAKLKQELDQLRGEIGNVEQMKLNNLELTREINELRPLRARYEAVQKENVDSAQLQAGIAALEVENHDIDRERRDANERLTRARREIEAIRRERDRLAADLAQRNENIARLEQSLESHVTREEDYANRIAQTDAERARLKARTEAIEQSLLERGRELHDKEKLLDDAHERRYADLKDIVRHEHKEALDKAMVERNGAQQRLDEATAALASLKLEHTALQRKDIESGANVRELQLALKKLDADISLKKHDSDLLVKRLSDLAQEEKQALARVREADKERGAREGVVKQLEAEASEIRNQIERLREDRERKETGSSREARVEAIESQVHGLCVNTAVAPAIAEKKWLDGVRRGIADSGFHFPDRLLKAFHTSLKIADWSSLAVLAGVSGTGKSELPKLYARFGGMEFIPVPVLPNWDSPSDLFGFFDYLSGQFKPTQLLQALAQCTRKDHERMLVVMLDEMNLARVELYFSELLSRLEGRRHEGETPTMPVDVGSGMAPYQVPLGSNLLFVGTVNEDESTNTLSDKVLDRANVIYFPSPRTLLTRDQAGLAAPAAKRLATRTWGSWQRGNDVLDPSVRNQIKSAFNEINAALRPVNRAVAHRILQITERYVANHPDVGETAGETWRSAFEDQIAQKVMPKLRGITIESEGGRHCLEMISRVLDTYTHTPELKEDFKRACDAGDGQFLWCSSRYLEDRESAS